MFFKLLKNDFIQTGRTYMWLLLIGVAGGGIGALFSATQTVGTGRMVVGLLWNMLLMFSAFVLEVMAVVMILVSTNRSLFTERGYLTFSLPVSSLQMLASKFISNVLFMLLSFAEVVGLVYVSVDNMRRIVSKAAGDLMDNAGLAGLQETFSAESLGLPSFSEMMEFFAYLLVVILVFLILAMMIGLFVLTVSHVRPFQSKPGLWIPIFLVGVSFASYQLVRLASELVEFRINMSFGPLGDSMSINMMTAIAMIGLSIGLFFLTNWMLSRKISLK